MSRKPTTRAEQRARSRAAILTSALSLFGERGFHATSIADIARSAGVSKGLVYHHFAKKTDLIAAVLLERQHHVAKLMSSAPTSTSARERVRWMAHALARDTAEHPERFRLYLRALTSDDTRVHAASVLSIPSDESTLLSELQSTHPRFNARLFHTSLLGILTQAAVSPAPTPVEPLVDGLVDALLPE